MQLNCKELWADLSRGSNYLVNRKVGKPATSLKTQQHTTNKVCFNSLLVNLLPGCFIHLRVVDSSPTLSRGLDQMILAVPPKSTILWFIKCGSSKCKNAWCCLFQHKKDTGLKIQIVAPAVKFWLHLTGVGESHFLPFKESHPLIATVCHSTITCCQDIYRAQIYGRKLERERSRNTMVQQM